MTFSVLVLAAGQGTRMQSVKPKVLHTLAGKPLLHHVLATAQTLAPQQTLVVCGYKGVELQQNCSTFAVDWVWQEQQLGTGHAVLCAYPDIKITNRVLVLYGDVPLITAKTLQKLLDSTPPDTLGLLTADLAAPKGFGRVVRDSQGRVCAIVEEKDATQAQRSITEINSGIYVLPYKYMADWLSKLQPNNEQKELYLTDLIGFAVEAGVPVLTQQVADLSEIAGVNSQQQLAQLERAYQCNIANRLMDQGVKLYDPARIDIRGDVTVGKEVEIDINVVLEGHVELGDNVRIGPNVLIKNSRVAAGSIIFANSVIEDAVVGVNCQIGPFSRVRPGSQFAANCKVGNFVEIKNSLIDEKSKINHLSYIGDATVGKRVNIGAGVITCNYDGAAKHKTTIEDDVFIGSNCELVAPVTINEGATLGAGTTLTKDAPANSLTVSKKILTSIINWHRPVKEEI